MKEDPHFLSILSLILSLLSMLLTSDLCKNVSGKTEKPLTFFSWQCCERQESSKAVTSSILSVEGLLIQNDLSATNGSSSTHPNKAHLHVSHLNI